MACSSDGSREGTPSLSVETKPTPSSLASRSTKPNLSYVDGAGNSYELDGSSLNLVFSPVKASESSSGNYNGGASWSKVLSEGQYQALRATFVRAIAATDQQSTERSKGTGVAEIGSDQQAILTMSSTIRKKLEADLLALNDTP
jgi:hypothetical protein